MKPKVAKVWTIEELIKKSGRIMDNPIMAAIAADAPSPTAADEYVKWLGWPNEIAYQVRNAVRIRERFPDVWGHYMFKGKQLSAIFKFDIPGTPVAFGDTTSISQGIKIGKNQSDHGCWPAIFRELRFSEKKKTRTTLDLDESSYLWGGEKGISWVDLAKKLRTQRKFAFDFDNFESHSPVRISDDFTLEIMTNMTAGLKIHTGGIAVKSRIFFNVENSNSEDGRGFPVPVMKKFIEITDKNMRDSFDRLRIDLRMDHGPLSECQRLGNIIFERHIKLSEKYQAELAVSYSLIQYKHGFGNSPFISAELENEREIPVMVRKIAPDNEELSGTTRFPQELSDIALKNILELAEFMYYKEPEERSRHILSPIGFDQIFGEKNKTVIELMRKIITR